MAAWDEQGERVGAGQQERFPATLSGIAHRRFAMRLACLALALLLTFSTAGAAPAPDPGREAVKELEKLKKRLPEIFAAWLANDGRFLQNVNLRVREGESYKPELRLLRRIGPDRAKVVFLLAAIEKDGKRREDWDEMVTIFLSFQDGCWTTERIDTLTVLDNRFQRLFLARLMLAIDEAAEK
jgi:hypothetical protein